ncbi:hypothetical protein CEXT_323841 [Caerostris extrusa]|uniref:Uncharacterized protein n=1 Tax=Caerostris extrusa TaxID=172846 RepID=A0AAV4MUM4_CAEEX|nr:hypothetical protein CEXT_323841 [Caerostris extrusa]
MDTFQITGLLFMETSEGNRLLLMEMSKVFRLPGYICICQVIVSCELVTSRITSYADTLRHSFIFMDTFQITGLLFMETSEGNRFLLMEMSKDPRLPGYIAA